MTHPVEPQARVVETVWIPLSDGRRLAARLFLPVQSGAVPAILEYIPYRRRDGTRLGDDEMHGWFARNGLAGVRVDIAGTGDSDGLVEDEYVTREQDDAVEAIAWIAAQPWCSGAVGMIGISWGGFSGLQVAARRPPALKAVVSVCTTVDRYADDIHYMGGCLLSDTLDWGDFFLAASALPPDPAVVGQDRWLDMWRRRIEAVDLSVHPWIAHQTRDAYWRHGSVCEDYSRIDVPVLAVGGWADGYTAAVFRCVENIAGSKGLLGPWGHCYPHQGVPGPAIGFLHECRAWFGQWLAGEANGVEALPDLRLFVQDSIPPAAVVDHRPGRWIGLPRAPSGVVGQRVLHLGDGDLGDRPRRAAPRLVRSPHDTGSRAGDWCAYALGDVTPELPLDQGPDDAGSLVFDTPPLESDLTIVGAPRVTLRLAASHPTAQVAVRLTAVHPDGVSERITFGLLNLNRRHGPAQSDPMQPGVFETVTVSLREVGFRLQPGQRLRLAVSSGCWPMVWPAPHEVTLTLDPEQSALTLPVLSPDVAGLDVHLPPAEAVRSGAFRSEPPATPCTRRFSQDLAAERTLFETERDSGLVQFLETGVATRTARRKWAAVSPRGNPRPEAGSTSRRLYRFGETEVQIDSDVTLTSDASRFYLRARLRAVLSGKVIAERAWDHDIQRDGV